LKAFFVDGEDGEIEGPACVPW